jgi:hypothetical protein
LRVHQVLCAAGPVDAVTNQGLACRALFDAWGWRGDDAAAVIAPGMRRRAMHSLESFDPPAGDPIVVHYSGYARHLERLLERPNPMLVISHNITPASYFWAYQPVEGLRCSLAIGQLADLARSATAAAGVSEFNATELRDAGARDVRIIPVLVDRERLGPPADRPPPGPPTILFVGRLAPHKRQDLVIRAFALYRRGCACVDDQGRVGVEILPPFVVDLVVVSAQELRDHRTDASRLVTERLVREHRRDLHHAGSPSWRDVTTAYEADRLMGGHVNGFANRSGGQTRDNSTRVRASLDPVARARRARQHHPVRPQARVARGLRSAVAVVGGAPR